MARVINHPQNQYGLIAKAFHGLSIVAIIVLWSLGVWMVGLDYGHDWYDLSVHYHESLGILFSLLLILRLLWRWYKQPPLLSKPLSTLEKYIVPIVHRSLYGLSLITIFSGYFILSADHRDIAVFNLFTLPSLGGIHYLQADISGQVHQYAAWLLVILSAIHALAACKHHFIDKDKALSKIF